MAFGNRLWLIEYDLDKMNAYLSYIHKLLTVDFKRFEDETETYANSLTDEQREEYYEYKSEEYWELKDEIPKQLYLSFITSWYAFTEHQLLRACNLTSIRDKTQSAYQQSKGKGIFRAKDFLKKHKNYEVDTRHWQELTNINKIRNHIAHGNPNFRRFPEPPTNPDVKYITIRADEEDHYVEVTEAMYRYLVRHGIWGFNSFFHISPNQAYSRYLVGFGKEFFKKIYTDLNLVKS